MTADICQHGVWRGKSKLVPYGEQREREAAEETARAAQRMSGAVGSLVDIPKAHGYPGV